MTLSEIEAALDAGRLEAAMATGRWWKLRRNGRTQTWKTRPDDWSIPVKVGLKSCNRLTPSWKLGEHYRVAGDE